MSYICEFCGLRPESCACSVDLTEPRLESELAVSDNMMAVENSNIQKPYGLLDAPSPSDFFSLLVELETDAELVPLPKWTSQKNILKPNEQPICKGPIPTTPIKTKLVCPTIPKLERKTNMPEEIIFSHDDLQEVNVELFPKEEAHLQYLKKPQSPEYLELSNKLSSAESYQEFCSTLLEMKKLYDDETSLLKEDELPIIEYCETCCDFSCECDKMITCDCGALYHIDEPYQMCYNCEMAERKQDLIDQERYPDDIPDRYRYDSD